jgi:amino acid transporter
VTVPAGEAAVERTHEVEARSKVFRKELGFADLALTQILYIVGSGWVGTAAKLGDSHVIFWLAAIALFYLPQAAVVVYLNRLMPLEGGLYQWARVGLGEFAGFLTAWNLWVYAILVMATFGVIIANNFSYLIGSHASFTGSWWYTPVASSTALVLITFVCLLGLRTGKWLQDIGAIAHILAFSALIFVPFVALHRGTLASYHPLKTSLPAFTALNLNIFGKMAVGALSGFEYVAILAGECKNPARSIGRSVLVATPVIACMFIFGTGSVLALVPQKSIDLVSPIPQTLTIGYAHLSWAGLIVPGLIFLLILRQIGSVTLIFAGNTRLPMVAGWDGLLPRWFTHIHPRFRTPSNSILFVGVLILVLTIAGQAGVGVQEAFQLLDNAAGILYGFAYLGLFAIPIVAAVALGGRPPLWLRLAAVAGFGTSLLYCILSIFPIIEVKDWHIFTLKIVLVLLAVQLLGIAIYSTEKKHRQKKRQ